jgi:hypothetical protein
LGFSDLRTIRRRVRHINHDRGIDHLAAASRLQSLEIM